MIAPFKTGYAQDLTLAKGPGSRIAYAVLLAVMAAIPLVLGEFYVGELGGLFIFAIAGVGLMLLTGYTGLVSLGNAAFLGIGAYTNAILLARGVPFLISLPAAGLLTGSVVVETIFGLPGVGRYFVEAALNRDYTLVMGTVVLVSVFVIAFNLLVDIAYALLDPRVRITGAR